jgi:DNA-binding response OmpR family regulator
VYNTGKLLMVKRILVVEDEVDIRDFLKELLVDEGYNVQTAEDGIEALNAVKKNEPDLVVLDLGLPKMSGESVCLELRKKYPRLPIIILTGRDTTPDIIKGLQLGADDYVTKPFIADELLARVKARLRVFNHDDEKMTVADLELDPRSFEVKRGETTIALTPQEFKLLHYLMINKGHVLTRDMILNRIWPNSPDVETRVVDVYVGYLRKKIDAEFKKKLIHSVRGFGYTVRD